MEQKFVAWLRSVCPDHPAVSVGPSDDAAVLDLAGGQLVVTTDLLTEEVDFLSAKHDPRRIGHARLAHWPRVIRPTPDHRRLELL